MSKHRTFVLYNNKFSVWSHFCIVRELKKYFDEDTYEVDKKMGETYDASDTDNDEVIANLLQTQFNREYDTMLKRTEEKFNRDSKGDKHQCPVCMIIWSYSLISVSISFSNYRNSLYDTKDEDNADSNVDDSNRDFDRFVVSDTCNS